MIKTQIKSLALTSIMILYTLVGCKTPDFDSHWTDHAFTIDGEDSDWQDVPLYQLESADVSLGLSNDEKNLYILLLFNDPALARQAGLRGVHLKVSQRDEEDLVFEFRYAGYDSLRLYSKPRDSIWGSLPPDLQTRFISQQVTNINKIRVVKNGQSTIIEPESDTGLSAARITRNIFVGYEVRIPVQEGVTRPYAIGVGQGESFTIGFSLGEKKINTIEDMMATSDKLPMPGVNMGGFGDGRGGSAINISSLNEKLEVWLQIKLANR
jgi:hypothetical protein